jgi:HSP20 family protein
MFALMPWTKRRSALVPRTDLADDFESLLNRMLAIPSLTEWPMVEALEAPERWGVTTEETDKELMIRIELPGFEPPEIKVEVIGERLVVEAEHKEPEEKAKEAKERAYAHVKRTMALPPTLDLEKVEATYRNGVLEIHIPRIPAAVGRRIEVKT